MGEIEHGRRGEAIRPPLGIVILLSLALVASGCEEEASHSRDPIDYAAINEAAEGPAVPIQLQPIDDAALAKHALDGVVCMVLHSNDKGPVLVTGPDLAHVMIDGELVRLVPHEAIDGATAGVTHYDGKAYSIELRIENAGEQQAEVLVRDQKSREVFRKTGALRCPT